MSFTEFSYQLWQGLRLPAELYNEKNCRLQLGGSDQWATSPPVPNLYAAPWAARLSPSHVRSSPRPTVANSARPRAVTYGSMPAIYIALQVLSVLAQRERCRRREYIKILTSLTRARKSEELVAAQSADPGQRPWWQFLCQGNHHHGTLGLRNMRAAAEASDSSQQPCRRGLHRLDEEIPLLQVLEGVPTFEVALADISKPASSLRRPAADRAKVFPSKGELAQDGYRAAASRSTKRKLPDAYRSRLERAAAQRQVHPVQKARKTYNPLYRQIIEQYIVSARKYRPATLCIGGRPVCPDPTPQETPLPPSVWPRHTCSAGREVGQDFMRTYFRQDNQLSQSRPDGEVCNECDSCKAFNEGNSMNIIELLTPPRTTVSRT